MSHHSYNFKDKPHCITIAFYKKNQFNNSKTVVYVLLSRRWPSFYKSINKTLESIISGLNFWTLLTLMGTGVSSKQVILVDVIRVCLLPARVVRGDQQTVKVLM